MAEFKDYLNNLITNKHKYYQKCKEHAEDMSVHVSGALPKKLLDITRPNEPKHIKDYRLEIWQPVTKSLSEKIVNTVNRIFNPRLYKVAWKDEPGVLGETTLKKYLTEDFPYYRSMWNFLKETYTPEDFQDPNACMVIEPITYDIQDTEFFEPCIKIKPSEFLYDFSDGDYYTFADKKFENVYYYDRNIIQYWKNKNGNWTVYFEYEHNFNFVPVFRLGGAIRGKYPYYYESFINGVLAHWNRVVTLSSDLDAQYISHLYLQRWTFEVDCVAEGCESGRVFDEDGNFKACQHCGGSGKMSRSPYGEITINHDSINPDSPIPTPPAGYITMPIEIVTKVEERIKKEEERGFSSVNMDILNKVGENQSGIAKTLDRQDLDSFLLRFSNHVFEYVIPNLVKSVALWRYSTILNGRIDDILPDIVAPKEFTVLSLDFLTEEYKSATQAKVGDSYIRQIEEELINTRFKNNEPERLKKLAISRLNPLPNKTADELLTINNLLPREDQYKIKMALMIEELVTMAIEQNENFLQLPQNEQREILKSLAQPSMPNMIPSEV